MSLTQTTVMTTRVEQPMFDLQRRLQPLGASNGTGTAPSTGVQQVRFRGATGMSPTATTNTITPAPHATLARRFSFVWPFISKENAAGTEPFLKSRCTQLLRQFPAFLSGRHDESTRTIRDLISRVLTQLKTLWLVLAVYMSVLVLATLSSVVIYSFLLANKPLGLWFLVGCIAATGAIAGVSFTAKERPKRRLQQPQHAPQEQKQPRIIVN